MKERFSKLLLGEDMSGHGKGVSSALTLSNAITNLAGFFFNLFHFVIRLGVKTQHLRKLIKLEEKLTILQKIFILFYRYLNETNGSYPISCQNQKLIIGR